MNGNLIMKKFLLVAGFAAIATVGASAAMAGECSVAELKGHYTYWLQGYDAAGKPYAEVGQEKFDGAGNVTTVTGVAGAAEPTADKGTYTVNEDCTGTVTYESGAIDKIFIAPSGDSFVFSSAVAGLIQSGEDTRVDME